MAPPTASSDEHQEVPEQCHPVGGAEPDGAEEQGAGEARRVIHGGLLGVPQWPRYAAARRPSRTRRRRARTRQPPRASAGARPPRRSRPRRRPRRPGERAAHERRGQSQGRGDDEAGRDDAHAAQRAGHHGVPLPVGRQCCKQQHADQRHAQHARHRGQRAAVAEEALPDHQREVDHVRARQHLRERQHFEKLLGGQPALSLDQLTLRHRQHAAESLQREAREDREELGARSGARRPGGHVVGVRRHRARGWARMRPPWRCTSHSESAVARSMPAAAAGASAA